MKCPTRSRKRHNAREIFILSFCLFVFFLLDFSINSSFMKHSTSCAIRRCSQLNSSHCRFCVYGTAPTFCGVKRNMTIKKNRRKNFFVFFFLSKTNKTVKNGDLNRGCLPGFVLCPVIHNMKQKCDVTSGGATGFINKLFLRMGCFEGKKRQQLTFGTVAVKHSL